MKAVVFIGFMGCGKSTLSKRLSAMLGKECIDCDAYVEQKMGMPIRQAVAEKGETFFRDAETQALRELTSQNVIIAAGGGAVERAENRKILAEANTVFLNTPFELCYRRIRGDKNRFIAAKSNKAQLRALYQKRLPLYRECSSAEIIPERSPRQSAEKIREFVEKQFDKSEN